MMNDVIVPNISSYQFFLEKVGSVQWPTKLFIVHIAPMHSSSAKWLPVT